MPRPLNLVTCCFVSLFLFAVGCGDDDGQGLPASLQGVVPAAVTGMSLAAGLGGPLGPMVNALQKDQASVTVAQAQSRVDAAFLGSGKVASPASCTTKYWKDKGATFIFEKCTLVLTGQSLNEVITVDVSITPNARVTQTFGYLKLGRQNIFKGYVKVGFNLNGWSLLTADVAWPAEAADQTKVVLQGLKAKFASGAVTLDGLGAVGSGGDTVFTAKNLNWRAGDCLPSSGSLSYDDNKQTIIVAFSSATPSSGAVSLTVGNLPLVNANLLPPCVK